jgi:hypothetical protein
MTSRRGCAVSPKRHANTCAPIQRAPARCEADPVNNVCDFRPGGPSPGIPNHVTVRALHLSLRIRGPTKMLAVRQYHVLLLAPPLYGRRIRYER